MKTAMQSVMDIIEMEHNNGFEISQRVLWKMLNEAKETEKQQIIDANINGTQEAFILAFKSLSGRDLIFTDQDLLDQKQEAENYYEQTFETNKETLK